MKQVNICLLLSILLLSCGQGGNGNNGELNVNDADVAGEREEAMGLMEQERVNGLHCANVFFNNPNTGKNSTYTLEVLVEDGYVVDIHFADGHLDTSHFEAPLLDERKQCSLTTDRGYQYQIELLDSNEQCEKQAAQEVQCSGITKSGSRCKRHTSHPSGMCFQHR